MQLEKEGLNQSFATLITFNHIYCGAHASQDTHYYLI
jgi:hypothetical protein